MRIHLLAPALAAIAALTACSADSGAEGGAASTTTAASPAADLEAVAPALAGYRDQVVDQLWERDGLTARDRSLVTVAELIASGRTANLQQHAGRALDDGVTPIELSEVLTHLAFYAGWDDAMAAVPAFAAAYDARGVDPADLPTLDVEPLPLDEAAEAARDQQVQSDFGTVSPGVVESTRAVLFRDLWLRPDLAPRDRSLVTVVALVASGQTAQIPFHLGRAMDNGLTAPEVGETLHQLAHFAGWPRVFSAMPVVRDVLAERG